MLYDVSLRITYSYEAMADAGRHMLRLAPAHLPPLQRVIASSVMVEPGPVERSQRQDFFGNSCIEIAYDQPVSETVFSMHARVERLAPSLDLDISPDLAGLARELAATTGTGPHSPHHFRFASPRIADDGVVRDWALRLASVGGSVLSITDRVCQAIHNEMNFDPDATAVDMPYATAFANRRGVCQDFTHIAIAALRVIGIPSGYVSGYLRTIPPEGRPRLAGVDAMHAWVRAWCGYETGWIEFDPTNAIRAGADHIVIAHGRDYFDVAPVKGVLRTAGKQETTQAVDVVAV